MRNGRQLLVAGVASVGLVMIVLWLQRPGAMEGRSVPTSGLEEPQAVPYANAAATDPDSRLHDAPANPAAAVRVEASIARTVVGPDGRPIENVEISWTALDSEGPSLGLNWPQGDRESWSAVTTSTVSDEFGRFTLSEPPGARAAASVVWLTHPAHRASFWRVNAGDRLGSLPATLTLERAEPISVRVVLPDGEPAPGALVFQRLRLGLRERSTLGVFELEASFALQRRSAVDAEGRAIVPDLGGRMVLSAEHDAGNSPGWIGTAPDMVELRLGPSFTWTARFDAESSHLPKSQARIDVFTEVGSHREFLDSGTVGSLKSIGPRSAAWMAADRYLFELDSAGIPQHVVVEAPTPGGHVDVQFVIQHGSRFPVRVTDTAGAPLADAKVQWAWSREQNWQYATRYTDATGVVELEHSPLGIIWLVVDREGFIGYRQSLEMSGNFEGNFEVVLSPGASVTGVVHSSGKPVQDFTIMHRPVSRVSGTRIVDFQDRKDGTFSLDGLTLDETIVFAVSADKPRTKGQVVDLRDAVTKQLEFDLVEGASAHGLVLDVRTSEPVTGAEVQVWTAEVDTRMRPFGPRTRSDDRGRFRVDGLAIGEPSFVEVNQSGRAPIWVPARPEHAGDTDLGIIRLEYPASIQVELRLPPGLDPGVWQAQLLGIPTVQSQKFSPAGLLRFESLVPSGYFVSVWSPGAVSYLESCVALGGDLTTVLLDLTKGRTLDVEIIWDTDAPVIADRTVSVQSCLPGRSIPSHQSAPVPASGSVRFESVLGDRVRVAVTDLSGKCLGSVLPTPEELQTGRVILRMGGPERVVRVVDGRGARVGGVRVALGVAKSNWYDWRQTDSDGLISFGSVSEPVCDVAIVIPQLGGGVVRGVAFDEGAADVSFEPTAELSVRVLDGDEPLTGVQVGVLDGFDLDLHFGFLTTDERGSAKFRRCLPQPFLCQIDQTGLWPTNIIVPAASSGAETTTQVRRRGSVVLHAKRGGLALADVALHIASEEFATSIEPWIQDGRVTASDMRSVTDVQGRLRLDGLPRGPYRWSVTLEDGATISGRFEVEPQRRVDVDVFVP